MWCWIKELLGRGCFLPGEGHLPLGAAGHSLLYSGQQQLSLISLSWLPQSCSTCRSRLVSQFGMNGMKIPLSPSKFVLRAWPGASLIFRDGKGHRSHLESKSQPDEQQRENPGQLPDSTGTLQPMDTWSCCKCAPGFLTGIPMNQAFSEVMSSLEFVWPPYVLSSSGFTGPSLAHLPSLPDESLLRGKFYRSLFIAAG